MMIIPINWDDTTCCMTETSIAKMPTVEELLAVMQKFQSQDRVRKSRTYFDILGMEACSKCGRKAEYVEGPPETFKMCRCMYEDLCQQCVELAPMATKPWDQLMGITVEIVE